MITIIVRKANSDTPSYKLWSGGVPLLFKSDVDTYYNDLSYIDLDINFTGNEQEKLKLIENLYNEKYDVSHEISFGDIIQFLDNSCYMVDHPPIRLDI